MVKEGGRRLRLVRCASRAEQFPVLPEYGANASFGLPFTEAGARYYATLASSDYADLSFAILDDAGPVAVVPCDIDGGGAIGRFGSPIEIWQRRGMPASELRRVVREVFGELQRLSVERGAALHIRTSDRLDPAGAYGARLAALGAVPVAAVRATLDLGWSDAELLEAMHKGHRQEIRWGSDSLQMRCIDATNPDRALFDAYRLLHAEISGRVTRPIESWDSMFSIIAAGKGDLLLAFLDDELLGGTLILDGNDKAYYASAANRRDRFDKGLSHYPLFMAARRARERGRTIFDIGEAVGGTIDMNDPKQRAIGRFKSGFSSGADMSFVWTVPAKAA